MRSTSPFLSSFVVFGVLATVTAVVANAGTTTVSGQYGDDSGYITETYDPCDDDYSYDGHDYAAPRWGRTFLHNGAYCGGFEDLVEEHAGIVTFPSLTGLPSGATVTKVEFYLDPDVCATGPGGVAGWAVRVKLRGVNDGTYLETDPEGLFEIMGLLSGVTHGWSPNAPSETWIDLGSNGVSNLSTSGVNTVYVENMNLMYATQEGYCTLDTTRCKLRVTFTTSKRESGDTVTSTMTWSALKGRTAE